MLPKYRRVVVAVPLLGLMLSVGVASAQLPAPPIDSAPRATPSSDAWSGKTAADVNHVEGMVDARLHNAPKVGEVAPALLLAEVVSGRIHSLSEMRRQKPVVLFFGSYSCTVTQGCSATMNSIARRFGSVADFYMVYIREAHPAGGFGNTELARRFSIPDPVTFAERSAVAAAFQRQGGIAMTVLVDAMDDAAAVRWGAWPIRLFVIDQTGRVVFAGQQGPWFHKPIRNYNPNLPGVPQHYGNLQGYSHESLEEFLEKLPLPQNGPLNSRR